MKAGCETYVLAEGQEVMKAKPYVVRCGAQGCGGEAVYKLASQWSDGTLEELKPYGFFCQVHLREMFEKARHRHSQCRLAEGETLGPVRIYKLQRGARDQALERLPDVEESLSG